MPIDFKSLRKLETPQTSVMGRSLDDSERVVVLVKLRDGAKRPSFVTPRTEIAPRIFSAEIDAGQLQKLQADPSVESMSLSQSLPLIK
ncbi:hypothetical protein [Bradyrhizobium sp. Gha]|uniref:hypothetical protein n=1 Tax=Bradyrhizobium sp. Gha TaxID=1855318 RepID=UPI0008E4CCB9|nr:hypothetical protein [Bradyrhizobium sp. Gha]SFI61163.1 hypothetical protein SAMN05216525_11142 [Bradyrhizobium sp. Gha]